MEIKIAYELQSYFPLKKLAGIGEKNFPTCGKATNGKTFFTMIAKPRTEYYNCALNGKQIIFPDPIFENDRIHMLI